MEKPKFGSNSENWFRIIRISIFLSEISHKLRNNDVSTI